MPRSASTASTLSDIFLSQDGRQGGEIGMVKVKGKPTAVKRSRARGRFSGSRSSPISRPVGPARRSSSAEWPAQPVVQSTTTFPSTGARAVSTSSSNTGRCSPAGVLRRPLSLISLLPALRYRVAANRLAPTTASLYDVADRPTTLAGPSHDREWNHYRPAGIRPHPAPWRRARSDDRPRAAAVHQYVQLHRPAGAGRRRARY